MVVIKNKSKTKTKKQNKTKQQTLILWSALIFTIVVEYTNLGIMDGIRCDISIGAWNARGLDNAGPHLHSMLSNCDIVVISEHKLYSCQLNRLNDIHMHFSSFGRASKWLKDKNVVKKPTGHGGIGILWNNDLSTIINPCHKLGNDRICVIEINIEDGKNVYIIAVYMPQRNCLIDDFQEYLDVLDENIRQCSLNGEVIVIGDLNCHFGEGVDVRCWGQSTANAHKLLRTCINNNCDIVDIGNKGSGPTYTFYVEGIGKSYIDHCIMSKFLAEKVSKCEVQEDSIINTSDHLSIRVEINIKVKKQDDHVSISRVAWHKATDNEIEVNYTNPLSNEIDMITDYFGVKDNPLGEHLDEASLSAIISSMVAAMQRTSNNNMPKTQFSRKLKPYWNRNLTQLSKEEKRMMWIYRNHGRPTDPNHPVRIRYKAAKRKFVNALRSAKLEVEKSSSEEIVEKGEMDQRAFWYLFNKAKGVVSRKIKPVRDKDGKLITDLVGILGRYGPYFKELLTPTDMPEYDDNFKEQVINELAHIEQLSSLRQRRSIDLVCSVEDIQKLCKELKLKKAPGWDLIDPEHFRYGGIALHRLLSTIYNVISALEVVPNHFKKNVLVPIGKPGADATWVDNNRGISLGPIIGKLYEKLVVGKMKPWLQKNKIICSLQGAGQKGCSSLHTNWLLRETIAYNLERGCEVWVCMLDIRKAFDTVWIDGLLYSLYRTGIDDKLWRIIRSMYDSCKCAVKIGNKLSEWFEIKQGVHQGAPLSMIMFEIFLDPLLRELLDSGYGAHIRNINITCPSSADDTALVSLSKPALQELANISTRFSNKWRFQYNPTKCVVEVFSLRESTVDIYSGIKLGNTVLPVVKSTKHLGTLISTKEEDLQYIEDRIAKGRRSIYAFMGLGSYSFPINPLAASKIYKTVSETMMLYGLEVSGVSSKALKCLEDAQWSIGKSIQNISSKVPNPAVLPSLGWLSITSVIEESQLRFLWSILMLDYECVYKEVAVLRLLQVSSQSCKSVGPLFRIVDTAKNLNVLQFIMDSLNTGNFIGKKEWKGKIRDLVTEKEKVKWKSTCVLYGQMEIYQQVMCGNNPWCWWVFAKRHVALTRKCCQLLQLLIGSSIHEMDISREMCSGCGQKVISKGAHIVYECDCLVEVRQDAYSLLQQVLPPALLQSLGQMSVCERFMYITCGLNNTMILEWEHVFKAILGFISSMYNNYVDVLDSNM